MVEEDYIMRLIKEMVRVLLKLLFNIETVQPTTDLLEDAEEKEALDSLQHMIDDGNINEAENQLYEIISEGDIRSVKMALLFYSYLNEKNDEFLSEHDFSRQEIELGIRSLVSGCGLGAMADVFLGLF